MISNSADCFRTRVFTRPDTHQFPRLFRGPPDPVVTSHGSGRRSRSACKHVCRHAPQRNETIWNIILNKKMSSARVIFLSGLGLSPAMTKQRPISGQTSCCFTQLKRKARRDGRAIRCTQSMSGENHFAICKFARFVPIWLNVVMMAPAVFSSKNMLGSLAQFCISEEVGSPPVLTCTE